MARVGVAATLIVGLQAKNSIFTSGAVRLTKKLFNVMVNRSMIVADKNIGEYCGAYPHGTYMHSALHTVREVFIRGERKYHYVTSHNNYLWINVNDGYTLDCEIGNSGFYLVYKYKNYEVTMHKTGSGPPAVSIETKLKHFTKIMSKEPTISDLLDLDIPDYIKEPILKLRNP